MSTEIKVAHHAVADIYISWNTCAMNIPFDDEEAAA
jgi:hypothetical protein